MLKLRLITVSTALFLQGFATAETTMDISLNSLLVSRSAASESQASLISRPGAYPYLLFSAGGPRFRFLFGGGVRVLPFQAPPSTTLNQEVVAEPEGMLGVMFSWSKLSMSVKAGVTQHYLLQSNNVLTVNVQGQTLLDSDLQFDWSILRGIGHDIVFSANFGGLYGLSGATPSVQFGIRYGGELLIDFTQDGGVPVGIFGAFRQYHFFMNDSSRQNESQAIFGLKFFFLLKNPAASRGKRYMTNGQDRFDRFGR